MFLFKLHPDIGGYKKLIEGDFKDMNIDSLMQQCGAATAIMNLVRFAHIWNTGILE